MKKKRILWISPFVPYDSVPHAGGKIENFYLKGLDRSKFDIFLISIAREEELKKLDLEKYGIENKLSILKADYFHKAIRYIESVNCKLNPFHPYMGLMQNYRAHPLKSLIKSLSLSGYKPDIIILEWTQTVLLTDYINKIFPNIPVISIEEDVSYLSYLRKWNNSQGIMSIVNSIKYRKLKSLELQCLKKAALTIVNNEKDRNLLVNDGINRDLLMRWTPYYDNYSTISTNLNNDKNNGYENIVFFGAMARRENYETAKLIIREIMPHLSELPIRLLILGGNPPTELKKLENDKIKILGYRDDIDLIFSNSLCFVAPLVLGAGIKIKILEAMSSGIPVLTNAIGIEGIDAKDGVNYLHCEIPQEFVETIKKLFNDRAYAQMIGKNGKGFIKREFSMSGSRENFEDWIESLAKGESIYGG